MGYIIEHMNKTVLIVEDSKLLRKVVRDELEHNGFTVIEAEDGKTGLDVALTEHPDLIMLDLIMPVMDGMTMFTHLREDDWGKSVPVIMLTGADEGRIASWVNGEQLDFMRKENWMIDEVTTRVKKRLGME